MAAAKITAEQLFSVICRNYFSEKWKGMPFSCFRTDDSVDEDVLKEAVSAAETLLCTKINVTPIGTHSWSSIYIEISDACWKKCNDSKGEIKEYM